MTLLAPPKHFEIAADGANLPAVRDWAQQVFGARFPSAPAAEAHAFVLALHEAVRNIIEHAYDGWGGVIQLEASEEGRALVIRLTHRGRPFDGVAMPPDFDGSRDRGLGLFLMDRGLTRVRYRTTPDGRQQVELVKELEEEEQ